MAFPPLSPTATNKVISTTLNHPSKDALTEFISLPEQNSGCIEEMLDTAPPHADGSYFLFRGQHNEGTEILKLKIARVQHEQNGRVKIYIDSFDFDPSNAIYTFASSDLFDRKDSLWVQQQPPHFFDPQNVWLSLDEFRETYGNGREIPSDRVAKICALHDEIVLQDPPCFYNREAFDTNFEATLEMRRDLQKAYPGTFTILGDELHPLHYTLCFCIGINKIVTEDLTITAEAKYRTRHGSFDTFNALKDHYKLVTPISVDTSDSDSESEMG